MNSIRNVGTIVKYRYYSTVIQLHTHSRLKNTSLIKHYSLKQHNKSNKLNKQHCNHFGLRLTLTSYRLLCNKTLWELTHKYINYTNCVRTYTKLAIQSTICILLIMKISMLYDNIEFVRPYRCRVPPTSRPTARTWTREHHLYVH